MNVGLLLEMAAEADGDRIVVGPRSGGRSASNLLFQARKVATDLRARPVRYVGFVDLNSEAVPIALFGAALAGLPFVPVSYRLTDDQLSAVLRRISPAVVVAGPEATDRLAGFDSLDGIEVRSREQLLAIADGEDWGDTEEDDDAALPFVDPDDVAVLLFTSGTTGEPKAAVLRHRHLASYILTSVELMGAGAEEAQLVSVPCYHVAGVSAVLSSIYAGRRMVYLPGFEPDAWVRTVIVEHVTQAMVVPTMLGRILAVLDQQGAGLPTLRHLSYGGGRMPVEIIERAMAVLPDVGFVNAYGLTETSSTISVLTPDDHRRAAASEDPAVRRRLGSVGRPLPSIELEIRGPGGEVLSAGEPGEIHVRGEQVAGEYLGGSVLTEDGWFPTNDAGSLDEEGFLYLDGRLDDVIVRGGENLSPGEIEDALRSHPAVADAAVVGVPDIAWGEAVAAAVVVAPGAEVSEEELRTWVRVRLRSTKAPAQIELRDELPYSETGKLLRRVLRDELAER